MITDFVEEYNGFLSLTDEELERVQQNDQPYPQLGRYSYGLNGYWNNELLMENWRKGKKIGEI